MDDEYFIFFVAAQCSEDPRAERILEERVYPSLERSEGYREMMGDALHYCMPQRTKGGIIKTVGFGFLVALRRIQRVIDAIVRGLYYAARKEPLPTAVPIGNVVLNPSLDTEIGEKLLNAAPRGTSDGSFVARILGFADDDNAAIVHLSFYERLSILTGFGCKGLPRRSDLEVGYLDASLEQAAPCGSLRCTYSLRSTFRADLRDLLKNQDPKDPLGWLRKPRAHD